MAKIDASKLTKEQIQKAMACGTAEELMALAKDEGYDITKDEAEAYLAEFSVLDLDDEEMRAVAGGASCTYNHECTDVTQWTK